MSFKCPICGNSESKYIGIKNGLPYCRKCLSFRNQGGDISEVPITQNVVLNMSYSLTKEQKNLSNKLIELVDKDKNVLIYAVCGAGKTEIITGIIFKFLQVKKRVGIFIPRRDLVIEIGERLKSLFPSVKFSFVYGGHCDDLNGNVVVATTHQAYRFKKAFDLVIIDEIDAFPYYGDALLNYFVMQSSKGSIVSLSATPSNKDISNNEVLHLYKRFHGYPMPLPKILIANKLYLYYALKKILKYYQKENKSCFIYVPSIRIGHKLYKYLSRIFKSLTFVYSSIANRNQILNKIRNKHFTFVITTTILERGVTFENLQVVIFQAEHNIFDLATLLQICGRVGRKEKYPDGDIYLLATKNKKEFNECLNEVKRYNENL